MRVSLAGGERGDQLDQALDRRRVEEVDAHHLVGAGGGDREPDQRDGGGVGGEDRVLAGDDLVEDLEDVQLDLLVLHDGLDHQVAVGELAEVGGEAQPAQRGVPLLLGELAALGGLGERVGQPGPAQLQRVPGGLRDPDVEPRLGADLGDAGAHLPGAHHSDALDVTHSSASRPRVRTSRVPDRRYRSPESPGPAGAAPGDSRRSAPVEPPPAAAPGGCPCRPGRGGGALAEDGALPPGGVPLRGAARGEGARVRWARRAYRAGRRPGPANPPPPAAGCSGVDHSAVAAIAERVHHRRVVTGDQEDGMEPLSRRTFTVAAAGALASAAAVGAARAAAPAAGAAPAAAPADRGDGPGQRAAAPGTARHVDRLGGQHRLAVRARPVARRAAAGTARPAGHRRRAAAERRDAPGPSDRRRLLALARTSPGRSTSPAPRAATPAGTRWAPPCTRRTAAAWSCTPGSTRTGSR